MVEPEEGAQVVEVFGKATVELLHQQQGPEEVAEGMQAVAAEVLLRSVASVVKLQVQKA